MTSLAKSSFQNGLILAIFALLTTGLTSITWLLTKDQIESEKELALLRAISELVPPAQYSNDPYNDCVLLTDQQLLGSEEAQQAWRLRNSEGENVAALISSVAPNGYSGKINIIVGHYLGQDVKQPTKSPIKPSSLAGVRVTSHKETPGLGDKIEVRKSDWILQFAGLSTDDVKSGYWQVKKDGGEFDAFTGATITPRAVLTAIEKNIAYFQQHQQDIFSAPASCQSSKLNPANEIKSND